MQFDICDTLLWTVSETNIQVRFVRIVRLHVPGISEYKYLGEREYANRDTANIVPITYS
jgi:hypothetical protein